VFDVYLETLAEELLELEVGIPAYDITKDGGRTFQLRTKFLEMIHDFSRYSMVGGFSHQGLQHIHGVVLI